MKRYQGDAVVSDEMGLKSERFFVSAFDDVFFKTREDFVHAVCRQYEKERLRKKGKKIAKIVSLTIVELDE